MILKRLFFALTIAVSIISCSVQKPIEKKEDIKTIVTNPSTVFVDVRVKEQYAENTVKGAVNIPLAELEQNLDFFKDKKVVIFCNTGKQADKAMILLKKNKIENVYDGTSLKNVKAIFEEAKKQKE